MAGRSSILILIGLIGIVAMSSPVYAYRVLQVGVCYYGYEGSSYYAEWGPGVTVQECYGRYGGDDGLCSQHYASIAQDEDHIFDDLPDPKGEDCYWEHTHDLAISDEEQPLYATDQNNWFCDSLVDSCS